MKMLGQIGVNIIGLLCLIAAANLISGCSVGEEITFVSREGWSALSPAGTKSLFENRLVLIVVYQTGGQRCDDTDTCASLVNDLQKEHINTKSLNDIRYNFLIGGDNKVYEGTGWNVEAAHLEGTMATSTNPESIGIGFIGTFMDSKPPDGMVSVLLKLIRVGRAFGSLHPDFDKPPYLCTNRHYHPNDNSGKALYDTIDSIPEYVCDFF